MIKQDQSSNQIYYIFDHFVQSTYEIIVRHRPKMVQNKFQKSEVGFDLELVLIVVYLQPTLQKVLELQETDRIVASHSIITRLHILKIDNKRSQPVQYFLINFCSLEYILRENNKMKRKRLGV